MKGFRNWIEEAIGKEMAWTPVCIGIKDGRRLYTITFEDGTEGDYFIDYENLTIEKY